MQQSSPDPFVQSCLSHIQYPRNLVPDVTKHYACELEKLGKDFAEFSKRLCFDGENGVDLPIRDLYSNPGRDNDLQEGQIKTSSQLKKWLEDNVDTQSPPTIGQQNRCPKCRFVYVYAGHSRARLRLTHDMLTQILTYHQVMPGYLDFLWAFGAQDNPRRQFFSGFYQHTMLGDDAQVSKMIGRSWRQYQLCYNLRGVASKQGPDGKLTEWTVRQTVIYHQFDVVHGTAVWILTKGRKDLLKRIDRFTKSAQKLTFDTLQDCFQTNLELNRMLCHWSTEDWRQYIDWLEDGLDSHTFMALYGSQDSKNSRPQYKPDNMQEVQILKEKSSQATMLLESNADVMAALRDYYVKLLENGDFPLRRDCQKNIQNFAANIDSNIIWIRMQVRRLSLLVDTIDDRKNLVAQHFQNQAAERAERLNLNLEKEAIVMRIITIVTLVYLPATFVSTFFSTDVVKYQNSSSKGQGSNTTSYSQLAMVRWLQVTLPLTFVTMLGAWMVYRSATNSRKSMGMKSIGNDRKDEMTRTKKLSVDLEKQ